jgi:N-acetylglucosamine-6-phosphate deacetylase
MAVVVEGRDPWSGRSLRVTVAGGRIESIESVDRALDLWLAPGLVDLQVNGFAGHDLNAGNVDPSTVVELVRSLAQVGVTTFAPTIITAPEQQIIAALRVVAAARAADPMVARAIPFVHLEGPFLSAEDGPRGAHVIDHIRQADLAELERWQAACDGLVGMVTLSPHSPEAVGFVAEAGRRGVRCAIGHTHATPEQILHAVDAGAGYSTHLGNGAHATLPRHPNYIWSQLAEDRLTAGFIADGHHLPAETFRAMLRAKGRARAFLVSDATALAGMAPGRYRTAVGGEVELSEDGRLSLVGTPFLAGAARSLPDGVACAVDMAGLTLAAALELASGNPGRIVGDRGVLRPGSPADLILFRWAPGMATLHIELVVASGIPVYEGADRSTEPRPATTRTDAVRKI